MPYRILHIHASAELYGSDLILLQLVSNLDPDNYESVVVLPFEGPLAEEIRKTNTEVIIMDLAVLRRNLFNLHGILQFSMNLLKSVYKISRIVKSRSIRLIHTNTTAIWGGGLAAKLCQIPHISSAMEIIEKPFLIALAMAWEVSIFSDRVLTVSRAVRDHFVKLCSFGAPKYRELFPPVDLDRFSFSPEARKRIRGSLGIDEKTILVGMAGRLNHWKGQEIFVRACSKLLTMIEDAKRVHFVVLGGPVPGREEFERDLHREIVKLGISKWVTAPGFQVNITEWMSAMDVFVLPSKLPEPSSTGVVAAMVMGLPVVGTNIGGTPETVIDGETGFLVKPGDPEDLAEKIAMLVVDDDLRNSMARKASERSRRLYSIDRYVKEVMKVYDHVLRRKE